MKEFVITKEKSMLIETSLKRKAPINQFIEDCPFSKCDIIPQSRLINFVDNLIANNYYNTLLSIEQFDDLKGIKDSDTIKTAISQLTRKCKAIETKNKDTIEKICSECVKAAFSNMDDYIDFECHVVDSVTPETMPNIDPASGDGFEYNDTDDINNLSNELDKRRIINALIEGGAGELTEACGDFFSKMHYINPELPILYTKIQLLSNLLDLCEIDEIDDKTNLNGFVEVVFRGQGNKPSVKAQGITAFETVRQSIKGMLEVFASHGLPDDRTRAMYILGNTEYLKAEQWYRVFGTQMWKIMFNGVETDTEDIPHVIMSLSCMEYNEFSKTVQEILSRTKAGKEIVSNLISSANDDYEYTSFEDSIRKRNSEYDGTDSFTVGELEAFNI